MHIYINTSLPTIPLSSPTIKLLTITADNVIIIILLLFTIKADNALNIHLL